MFWKSRRVSAILNGIKTKVSIIFPLSTFPYAARVLQVENLGKVNFSSSVVTYFTLLAALGVSTYAIREGSGEKNDNNKFNEISALNMILNENNGTFTRDELINYNIRVMLQKKRVNDIATENVILNRIMQLYKLGIFSM